MAIHFHNADVKFSLTGKAILKKFIIQQISISKRNAGTLSFVFCSDEYLLQINRQFLKHDYYTDIITFPLEEDSETLEGEIYISVDRVKENSQQLLHLKLDEKTAFLIELQRVIFHGVLHLLGYKDKTKMQKDEMRQMEDLWLKRFKKFQEAE